VSYKGAHSPGYICVYIYIYIYIYIVAQQPKWGLGHLIVYVSRSHTRSQTHTHTRSQTHTHTHTHTHTLARSLARKHTHLVGSSERVVSSGHNKHKGRTSMPSARFEPTIPAIKRMQTYALDCTATGVGRGLYYRSQLEPGGHV
jgi:hypothetical protein